jgi:cell division septum initiation protein DivIVA
MRSSSFCIGHDPDQAEARRRRASKGGKRGGRGRPQAELANIKARLSDLADGVIEGRQDRQDAAVVGQLLNTVIRAVSVELKAKEQLELVERLEMLEEALEQKGGRRYGA